MIFIASSWRNRERVRSLAVRLRSLGFDIFDFTDPADRDVPEIPPERFPDEFDPEEHRYDEYLDRPEWRAAVEENRRVIDRCALVVLLLPCGADATADWAYGVGRGKQSIIVGHPPKGERSPVHLWADRIFSDEDQAVAWMLGQRSVGSDTRGEG